MSDSKHEMCPLCRANARLIAAAPELLEALRDLMLSCGALDGDPRSDNRAERQARTAIDKAEGQVTVRKLARKSWRKRKVKR